jgi:ArsR family transcriptional regulator
MGLGQSTASEQLAILKRAGLLQSRKEGKEVYYRPDSRQILGLLKELTEQISRCCPPQ